MGLIEQAAKRLEELRRAGAETGEEAQAPVPAAPAAPSRPLAQAPAPRVREVAPERATRHVALDLAELAKMGFVTPDKPRSHIADEFRIIKRPIIANATHAKPQPIRHGNLIMVTSALPGEGKTFVALNLAMSMAMEMNRTVLLVDGDVARPSLPGILGTPEGPGMLDLLEGRISDAEAIIRTSVEGLRFMPSGPRHPRASELLASDAMSTFLDDMASRYPDRLVVFDSPPLLVTTEARVLATRMGQIVFVVDADRTLQADAKRALGTIESCPVKLMVLNGASAGAEGGYGYGYGYGYGD